MGPPGWILHPNGLKLWQVSGKVHTYVETLLLTLGAVRSFNLRLASENTPQRLFLTCGWAVVPDKYAYFAQHPETHASTLRDAQALEIDRNGMEMHHEAHEAQQREDRERGAAAGHQGCVGGKVMKGCEECRGSFVG